jgi:hypothetical protein
MSLAVLARRQQITAAFFYKTVLFRRASDFEGLSLTILIISDIC